MTRTDWMLAQEDPVAEDAAYHNRLHDTMQDTWGTMTQGANAALGGVSTMTTAYGGFMAEAMPFMKIMLDDFIDEMMEIPRDKFGRKIRYTTPLPLPRDSGARSDKREAVRIKHMQDGVSARTRRPRSYQRRRY